VGGAASAVEVENLLREIVGTSRLGDACLVMAIDHDGVVGLGYWRRYSRPTHHPHVDVEKVAVSPAAQGRRVGRRIMEELLVAARDERVEVVTLDLRADNHRAAALYESLGFERYGSLPLFVAVGDDRYDKYLYALDLRKTPQVRTR
jgi:ribosomal protein S18 acetylase RimI-like enzyme